MPVFIVTTPEGGQFKLIADDQNDALQKAAQRTGVPAVRLGIANALTSGVAGSGTPDKEVFSRLDLPALTTEARDAQIRSGVAAAQARTFTTRNAAGRQVTRQLPVEEVSGGNQFSPTGFGNINITGQTGSGGTTFGPSFPLGTSDRVQVNQQPGGGETTVDSNGNIITNNPDGSVTVQTATGEVRTFPASGGAGTSGLPATTGGVPATAGGNAFGDVGEIEAELPGAAFRSFLRGGGVQPGGVAGRVLGNQFGNAINVLTGLQTAFPEDEALQNLTFRQFLGAGPLGGQRFSALARQALPQVSQALGAGGGDFAGFGEGRLTDEGALLANLARLGTGVGAFGRRFLPSNAELFQRGEDAGFGALTGGPAESPFDEFLRRQFAGPSGTLGSGFRAFAGV